jgi:hypothetical protein
MSGNRQSPFWNQDAIVAGGLAFAGLAVLQSKLLPEFSGLQAFHLASLGLVSRILEWRGLEWWPLLLIVAGILVWLRTAYISRRNRTKQTVRIATEGGGTQ